MMNNLTLIGSFIKAERKYRKLAQNELAQLLHVNQSTVSRIENGDSNITLEHYDNALRCFNIYLNAEDHRFEEALVVMYHSMDEIKAKEIQVIYDRVNSYLKLNVTDYYLKKLIEACYHLFIYNIKKFNKNIEYLMEIEAVYESKSLMIFLVLKGYYYHLKREYLEADHMFREACVIEQSLELSDNALHYIFAYNNIILRRYRLSHHDIMELINRYQLSGNIYKEVITRRLLGFIYFFDSNYQDAIDILEACSLNEYVLQMLPNLRIQCNSYIGASYLGLKQYKDAIPYYKDNIDNRINNDYLIYYYAYLFYCFKKTNQRDEFIHYKNQLFKEEIYQIKENRIIIDIFSNYDDFIDIDLFVEYFNFLFQQIFQHSDCYQHMKLAFSLVKDTLWKKRKYLMYKQFSEVCLRVRVGGICHGI
ncbi:helix-turn-helix transcriptional regulator [Mycoplasmatota bacterium]|nr:helix-turn-helix transcriptional regulator [Mycoplasmatota bacterium]